MGRILAIALENKVDIKQVLEYPLTPVSLSLCHIDGLMNKTPKATLFQKLEACVTNIPFSLIDAYIVHGICVSSYIFVWIYQSNMGKWHDTFYRSFAVRLLNGLIQFLIVSLRSQSKMLNGIAEANSDLPIKTSYRIINALLICLKHCGTIVSNLNKGSLSSTRLKTFHCCISLATKRVRVIVLFLHCRGGKSQKEKRSQSFLYGRRSRYANDWSSLPHINTGQRSYQNI